MNLFAQALTKMVEGDVFCA